MTISKGSDLLSVYRSTVALGDKALSSDATAVISGHEDISLLIKQFPWPYLTPQGEIEVSLPNGSKMWQAQQVNTAMQGPVTFMETVTGHIAKLLEDIVDAGGKFEMTLYEGSKDSPTRTCRLFGCFFQGDNPDRDWENRAQIVTVNGTLFYHYFGDKV